MVWKALDIDSTGVPSSYNMEYAQDYIRDILTTKQGRHAREPTSKFLQNASLFLFDTAEGLALEHFLGPKEVIGGKLGRVRQSLDHHDKPLRGVLW